MLCFQKKNPPEFTKPYLGLADDQMLHAILNIIDAPTADPDPQHPQYYKHSMQRLRLSLGNGGLGCRSMTSIVDYAFLGSTALAAPILKKLLPLYKIKGDKIEPAIFFAEAQALLLAGVGAAANITDITDLYTDEPTIKLQNILTTAASKDDFTAAYNSAPDDDIKAHMLSQNTTDAPSWLGAIGANNPAFCISNHDYPKAAQEWLGLPTTRLIIGNNPVPHLPPANQQFIGFTCNDCDAALNKPAAPGEPPKRKRASKLIRHDRSQHCFCCRHTHGLNNVRHRCAVDITHRFLDENKHHSHGIVLTHREPFYANNGFVEKPNPPASLADEIKRADIIAAFPNGDSTLIDCTATYIRRDVSSNALAGSVPNTCANTAINNKTKKFNARWTNPPQNAHVTVLFAAIETSGHCHPDFTEFLHKYLRSAHPGITPAIKNLVSHKLWLLRMKLSVAMRNNVAHSIHKHELRARHSFTPRFSALVAPAPLPVAVVPAFVGAAAPGAVAAGNAAAN